MHHKDLMPLAGAALSGSSTREQVSDTIRERQCEQSGAE